MDKQVCNQCIGWRCDRECKLDRNYAVELRVMIYEAYHMERDKKWYNEFPVFIWNNIDCGSDNSIGAVLTKLANSY